MIATASPGFCCGLFNNLHLAIDTQDFHHLGLKVGVTAFQVVMDLVGLDLLLVVNSESPHKSLKDLVAWSKANPAASNYASS